MQNLSFFLCNDRHILWKTTIAQCLKINMALSILPHPFDPTEGVNGQIFKFPNN